MRADVEQQRLIGGVEHAARADRHAADRIAVIAVLQRDDAAARRRRCCASSRAPSSARPRRWSSRCRRRTRAPGPAAAIVEQPARQRLGRLVREAGEDDLVELRAPARRWPPMIAGWQWPWVTTHQDEMRIEDAAPVCACRAQAPSRAGDHRDRLGCSACWVNGCQIGLQRRRHATADEVLGAEVGGEGVAQGLGIQRVDDRQAAEPAHAADLDDRALRCWRSRRR